MQSSQNSPKLMRHCKKCEDVDGDDDDDDDSDEHDDEDNNINAFDDLFVYMCTCACVSVCWFVK